MRRIMNAASYGNVFGSEWPKEKNSVLFVPRGKLLATGRNGMDRGLKNNACEEIRNRLRFHLADRATSHWSTASRFVSSFALMP